MPLALVTGPTSGIGRSFARALAHEGHDLVLVSRDEARLHDLAGELTSDFGVACEVLSADLAEREQIARVEARLASQPFDVVVNNAGFGLRQRFDINDVAAEQVGVDVLVTAVMRLSHAAVRAMIPAGRGAVVNVSSVAGFIPRGTYGAHKAWVTSFSAWANVAYRPFGLQVMALCPGFVRTEFHSRMDTDVSGIPGLMWLDADRVVATALKDLRAGKAISIPTARYRALVALARVTPRAVVERAARRR